jgi:hypothetical protein
MTEERPLELDRSIPPRLRPLVARLLEIERKCGTLGPRNEEARDMAARLRSVIADLSQPGADELPPPSYRELARQLFPVARLFESLGFMSVAREVNHVERLLTEMGPPAAPPAQAARGRAPVAPTVGAGPSTTAETTPLPEAPSPPRRRPTAVFAALAVLVLAVIAAAAVVIRQQSGHRLDRRPLLEPPAAAGGAGSAAQAGTDATARAAARPSPTPHPRARLADLIGEARLAEQGGDLDRAIDLLNQAAAIDVEAGTVRETAQLLVLGLVARADQAAAEAAWESAAALLQRARDLALRFDLPTQTIDEAERRHGGLERYRRLGPQDLVALRAAVGSTVVVVTDDGAREGRLVGVTGASIELQLGLEVADNGTLLHTGQVSLASVREVRVYPD